MFNTEKERKLLELKDKLKTKNAHSTNRTPTLPICTEILRGAEKNGPFFPEVVLKSIDIL